MVNLKRIVLFFGILLYCIAANAQQATVSGNIVSEDSSNIEYGIVVLKGTAYSTEIAANGSFRLKKIPYGTYTFIVLGLGKLTIEKILVVDQPLVVADFILFAKPVTNLDEVLILSQQEKAFGIVRLQSIQNFTVYEGKKNEVIVLKNLSANTATNNARQIYGSITGLNIWESDGAGLQLGIGGRGLSPNRTANFNTRQNGYDISADALGYPESYYTPATEALEKIEVIRGAASLQYGTQFGGAVNFIFKKPVTNKVFEHTSRQTIGSWNFINSFNSFSGTAKNKKLSYYTFYQRKQGDGYRPNSRFKVNNLFAQINYSFTPNSTATIEYTHMDYLAKQAGGLTDANFKQDPRQSVRNRNWFKVDWNLLALSFTHKFSAATQLNIRNFALLAQRQSLGNLERINVVDFNQRRTLIDGQFKNIGSETRLVHRYKAGKQQHTFLAGIRLYAGRTMAKQGDADSLSGPNFTFLTPNNVEGSDYRFPNFNVAVFAEHIFNVSDKLSITPGVRFEYIKTNASGYFRQRVFDFAGNVVADNKTSEAQSKNRSFVIAGIGINYKPTPHWQLYTNISQNYRAINFTDLRVQNPNFIIDTSLADEKGFTSDLGMRGNVKNVFTYEITAFYLYYNNRIGQILKADQPPLYLDYRFRTNVAASRNIGIETYGALNIARLFPAASKQLDVSVFVNAALLNALYIKSKDNSIQNKEVEMVPPFIVRSGINVNYKKWKSGFQINHVAQHFSDATNATLTATAVEGIIAAYTVSDITAAYQIKKWLTVEASCNNVFNQQYFTRRAESYPGPGIIPSDGRSIYVTLQVQFGK